MLIGEAYLPSVGELLKMYGARNDELHLPMDLQYGFGTKLSAEAFRSKLLDAETRLEGNAPLLVFDNHDNTRSWTRYADGVYDLAIAKLIATLLLTPRCSALMYYGQELGMSNSDPQRKEDVRDPVGLLGWPQDKGRDGERTPMQWNDGPNAGFTTATSTWLPVAADYKQRNVVVEEHDPQSLLNYYKALLHLRRNNAALSDGEFRIVNPNDPGVLCFVRGAPNGRSVVVALNCRPQESTVRLEVPPEKASTLLASFPAAPRQVDTQKVTLPAYGAWVGEIH